MKELFNSMQPDNEMMPLEAIRLEKPLNGQSRYTDGDLIAIEDGKMIEATHATHKILGCFGTTSNSRLEFMVCDLISGDVDVFQVRA